MRLEGSVDYGDPQGASIGGQAGNHVEWIGRAAGADLGVVEAPTGYLGSDCGDLPLTTNGLVSVPTGLGPQGLKRRIVTTVGGFLGLPWLPEDSHWIAMVPTHIGHAFAQRFPLGCVALPIQVPPYPITSHWHPRSQPDPGHRWMRHIVFDLMRRYPDLS